jgi:hypothetical protein
MAVVAALLLHFIQQKSWLVLFVISAEETETSCKGQR